MSESVRLFLLAKYPVVCAGVRQLLAQYSNVDLVAQAGSVAEALTLVSRERFHVILLDPDSEEIPITAVATLAETCHIPVLVFTAQPEAGICVRAMELGAAGVVSKKQPGEVLVRAILKVHEGELWLDRIQTARVLSHAMKRGRDPEQARIETLTVREREIVAKVGEGLKNSVIAQQLFISEATVRNHLTSILGKLELTDRFELAVYAFRNGLVRRPEEPMTRGEELVRVVSRGPRDEAAARPGRPVAKPASSAEPD